MDDGDLTRLILERAGASPAAEIIWTAGPGVPGADSLPKALLLIKPSVGKLAYPLVYAILNRLTQRRWTVLKVALYNGAELERLEGSDETRIISRHYGRIADVALRGSAALNALENKKLAAEFDTPAFRKKFGEGYLDSMVVSVPQALQLGLTRERVNEVWNAGLDRKLTNPLDRVVKIVNENAGNPVEGDRSFRARAFQVETDGRKRTSILLNGFYPALAGDFFEPGSVTVACIIQAIDQASADLEHDLRPNYAGETTPSNGPVGSIRRDAADGKLGLNPARVNARANVIHLSESPQAGLREIELWFAPLRGRV